MRHLPSILALLLALGCVAPNTRGSRSPNGGVLTYVPDLPISHPPFDVVQASWKQRMDVPYVYFEHFGSYASTGALIPGLQRELIAQGLEPDGPPFGLFYDDPARTPVDKLRSRACIPIRGPRAVRAPLGYEVLRSTTVAYAFVSGNYPEAPRAYPGIFEYMRDKNWELAGPIRQIYLVPPGDRPVPEAQVCEIQIPARPRAGL